MISDEERLKEMVRYKTEQLKLLAIAFMSMLGGCISLLMNLGSERDFFLSIVGLIFCATLLFYVCLKHLEIKKLLKS